MPYKKEQTIERGKSILVIDDKKETEGKSIQIQEHAPNDESKETKGEKMQIQEYTLNDESKEMTEGESIQIQKHEKEKETISLNNMSNDDIEGVLC